MSITRAVRYRRRLERRSWWSGRSASESGLALIATILVMVIVMALLTVIYNEGIQTLPLARNAQNYQAALQAADAGVEDYINRLDNNAAYYLETGDPGNPAFSGWTPVPGTNVHEWFRYAIDNQTTARNGVVHLIVSGAAGTDPSVAAQGNSVRTVNVSISLSGFTSFLYYTDYEIVAPSIATVDGGQYTQECQFHAWEWNTYTNSGYGPDPSCAPDFIYFADNDTLNGPVFSNDEMHICGSPSFPQGATTAYNQATSADVAGSTQYGGPGAVYDDPSCYNNPSFGPPSAAPGSEPAGAGKSDFPATNTNMESDLAASNDGGGCSYTGPNITVVFNSDGTMTVTVGSRSTSSPPPGATFACSGSHIPLPPNGLLYDANPTGCARSSCYANVNVSGTVAGQVTVGSQTNITIQSDLVDASTSGGDVIGLSATNSIILPADYGGVTIDAAMVALDNSIYLPDWSNYGSFGDLNIYGSLAQEFRGPVGTTSGSGYTKNYNWDPRLKYLQPPYFTSPTLPNWVKSGFAECNPTRVPTATTC
ncbi:MAG: pilus assembly PilX family protein [Acidimicrobiales bacterium]